ncbi:nucleoside triphosphate pyrophosphohydrolase [Anaerosolibacter sp.]|uniref:nucleoside triphosphate pyrophosphohydrolase n=1 Tax=Anaerosolibacter sp. TaxID=1872527 RepID=UPI0039EFF073
MKREIIYNKLVRDKIPEIIQKDNKECEFYIASEDEYINQLYSKVVEELNEFKANPCEEEMADILEVLSAIGKHYNFEEDSVQRIRYNKNQERGKFDKRIILQKVMVHPMA